jgi:two-component system chemotaxis response regulator CheY
VTVLIADDSATILKIMKNALVSCGVEPQDIYEALNGQEAYNQFHLKSPDLVFTDWNMPVMNGLEFIKKIRAEGYKTPIIMITSEGRKNDILTAVKAGVNDYIVKPFTPKTLKEKISKYFDEDKSAS